MNKLRTTALASFKSPHCGSARQQSTPKGLNSKAQGREQRERTLGNGGIEHRTLKGFSKFVSSGSGLCTTLSGLLRHVWPLTQGALAPLATLGCVVKLLRSRLIASHSSFATELIFLTVVLSSCRLLHALPVVAADQPQPVPSVYFETDVVRWLGWLFILLGIAVVLPGALLPALAVPGAILLTCHIVPLEIAAAIVRQTERQQRLLFLLTSAVDHHRPLPEELDTLALSAGYGEVRQLRHLSDLLRAGRALPEALDAVPDLLPLETVSAIRVAAVNHSFEVALRQGALREDARLQGRHRRQLGRLTIFTPFLARLLIVFCCVAFLMYWIVPKLKVIFDGFNVRLPVSTQILFRSSDFFARNSPAIFATVLIVSLLTVIFRRRVIPRLLDFSILRSREPIAQMMDQLALTAEVSLPWRPVVGALAQSPAMWSYRRKLATVERAVEQGEDLWESLSRQNLITNSETELLLAAEKVGNLPWTLRLLADRIENRVEVRSAQVTAAVQFVGLLAVGCVVGGICVAIFHPLLRIYS